MYEWMIAQIHANPSFGLGGPSLRWLHEALKECRDLASLPSPDLPCLTLAGTNEDIVCKPRIRARMAKWPGSHLEWIDGGRHEVLMEDAETRKRLFNQITAFYDNAAVSSGLNPASRAVAGGQAR